MVALLAPTIKRRPCADVQAVSTPGGGLAGRAARHGRLCRQQRPRSGLWLALTSFMMRTLLVTAGLWTQTSWCSSAALRACGKMAGDTHPDRGDGAPLHGEGF